jgi:hypothetical protein
MKYETYSVELIKDNNSIQILGVFRKRKDAQKLFDLFESLLANQKLSSEISAVAFIGWNKTEATLINESYKETMGENTTC